MSEDIAIAAVENAAQMARDKTLSLAFFGGEPTMSHNLIRRVVEHSE
jgi:sulfatase maturation enzyme AslB (radical SAM superfamily)